MPRLNSRWENFWKRGQAWYRFWGDAAGAATDVSATDAATETDVATRALGLPRSAADAASEVDSATRSLGAARSTADSGTTADEAVAATGVNLSRTASDAATQSDMATRLRGLARSASEAVSAADTAIRSIFQSIFRTTSDEASATDSFPAIVSTVPVPDHIIEDTPVYHGAAMAVHVEADLNPTVLPTAAGIETAPAMMGQAPAITTNVNSPDQFHLETLIGPMYSEPVYRGMSPAIHVWGTDATVWPPQDPIPCSGCGKSTCSVTDTFTRTIATGSGLGVSDSGFAWKSIWDPAVTLLPPCGVDGSSAVFTGSVGPLLSHYIVGPVDVTSAMTLTRVGTALTAYADLYEGSGADYVFVSTSIGNADTRVLITAGYSYGAEYNEAEFHLAGSANGSKIRTRFYAAGTDFKAKAWLDADAEPVAWNIELTAVASNPVIGAAYLQLQTSNFSGLPGSTWKVDWLDIVGVNRCTAVQFEDFNRTVVSGLGGNWVVNSASGTYGVNGASAYATNGFVSAYYPGSPAAIAGGFTMRARIMATVVPPSNTTPSPKFEFYVTDTSETYVVGAYVHMTTDGAAGQVACFQNVDIAEPQVIYTQKNDWVGGQWYLVKWEFTGNLSRIKVWPENSAEPALWITQQTLLGAVPRQELLIYLADGNTFSVDYIEFDYAGKPCYPGGPLSGRADCIGEDGFAIPDFTPGFMPTFRRQIGDPTTNLDSFICTLESAAMVLDWHTRGAVKVWGGELIPWCGKTEAQIYGTGTSLSNAQQAWQHWGQYLRIDSGGTWNDLMAALTEGRAIILQGDYGAFSVEVRCQTDFVDNHAISVYPYQKGDFLLVGDPICQDFRGFSIAGLQAYAEALGAAVYGVTSPQKILFAVSRPWVP